MLITESILQNEELPLHETIYQSLRERLAIGFYAPAQSLSLRNLAREFAISVTPIRDAVWRLAAESALSISATRRISVPNLNEKVMRELVSMRAIIEPLLAEAAMPFIDTFLLDAMTNADKNMNRALDDFDVGGYMAANHEFHFLLYCAAPSQVYLPILKGIWVRFGPFMRNVYSTIKSDGGLIDHHGEALHALKTNDVSALKAAISADIDESLHYLSQAFNRHKP